YLRRLPSARKCIWNSGRRFLTFSIMLSFTGRMAIRGTRALLLTAPESARPPAVPVCFEARFLTRRARRPAPESVEFRRRGSEAVPRTHEIIASPSQTDRREQSCHPRSSIMHDALQKELATYEKRTRKSAAAHKRAIERIPLGVASTYRHY